MSFPPHGSYQDSGVDWIGEVPTDWDVAPLKAAFSVVGGATPKSDVADYWDGGVPWITPGDLSRLETPFIGDTIRTISEVGLASCAATRVPAGSVILSTRAPIGSLGITTEPATTNQGCKALVPRHDADARFLAYTLSIATTALNVRGKGTTFLELPGDELARFKVPLPSAAEQTAVSAFLDRETGKIDALVEAQRQLIDLLKEKRRAVISHAVTKGLDPAAPKKDSGVEWLGEVPAHWEATALKRLCSRITDGAHISPETENGVYCFVSTRDVSQAGIDFEGCLRTSEASYEYLSRTGCKPEIGDVLFSKDGTIGRTVVVRERREFVVASSLIIIRPDAEILDADFLDFLCQSDAVQDQVESFVKGAGLPRLSITNLTRVIGVFPPRSEQNLIASHLAEYSEQFSSLVAEAEITIALLQERRAALISAAVTGKIDVRGLAPNQAEAA